MEIYTRARAFFLSVVWVTASILDLFVEHACARCQDQTGALHMFCDTNESESCLVKAPAKHASESVLVVGELLCTGVQADTERHTRKRVKCAHVGDTNNTPPRANRESGVIKTSNRARVWQIWEARKDT